MVCLPLPEVEWAPSLHACHKANRANTAQHRLSLGVAYAESPSASLGPGSAQQWHDEGRALVHDLRERRAGASVMVEAEAQGWQGTCLLLWGPGDCPHHLASALRQRPSPTQQEAKRRAQTNTQRAGSPPTHILSALISWQSMQ